ncbi:Cas4 family exonuclease [Streptomyces phage MulchMansion]|nr:Cas4 family exonuclease [Streptomyces phage MulchMansion]
MSGLKRIASMGKKADFDVAKLLATLEDAYTNSRPKERYSKKVSFSPSSLGYGAGTCPRYWYLAFEGGTFVDTFDGQSVANMANGTAAHTRIEKLFGDAGVLDEAEKEVTYQNPPIRGFVDVVVDFEGKKIVGEFKTTRQESYIHREANGTAIDYHKVQVLIYMRVLGIDDGFVLYENKNTQELFLVPLKMDERNSEYTDYLFEWMRETRELWENRTLPTRPFTSKNKACKSCALFNVCWNESPEGDITKAPLEVKK